jgi:hypothetical protein
MFSEQNSRGRKKATPIKMIKEEEDEEDEEDI